MKVLSMILIFTKKSLYEKSKMPLLAWLNLFLFQGKIYYFTVFKKKNQNNPIRYF